MLTIIFWLLVNGYWLFAVAQCFAFSLGSYPPYGVKQLPRSSPPWRVTPAGVLNGPKDYIVKFAFMLSFPFPAERNVLT